MKPGSLDLVKIDLDSFDCDVLFSMLSLEPLASKPPKLLYIDMNPHIPPPFLYRTISVAQSRIVPFQGSSLQCFLEAAPKHRLLHVELFNALLVHESYQELFSEAAQSPFELWASGYFCHPLARVLWHRERDIRYLGGDPRFWADESRSVAERGENILRTLSQAREDFPHLEFSLTWREKSTQKSG